MSKIFIILVTVAESMTSLLGYLLGL